LIGLINAEGFNMAARRFTISTVGLVPMIRRFTSERRQFNLAVSLHAADDELRNSMLPINKKYPLDNYSIRAVIMFTRQNGVSHLNGH
jgi:23S rRNA (adenine2503-C2)-methyltransferase